MNLSQLMLSSFAAPSIRAFLELRERLGYVHNPALVRTLRDFDYYLAYHAIASFEDVDERVIVPFLHSVPTQGAATKNNRLCHLRVLFRYWMRLGFISKNPSEPISSLRAKPHRPYIYTLQDIKALLEAAGAWKSRYQYPFLGWVAQTMVYLIYACGLRISEAVKLRIHDVDFKENTLSLWKTKFHKERLLPFSPETASKLRHYLDVRSKRYPHSPPEAPLFRHARGGYSTGGVNCIFQNLLKACGLAKPGRKNPRVHDLRHTFAVHRLYQWYQEGHDILNKLPFLSTYMGHVSVENTQVYLTITRALLREGNKRFREQFEKIPREFLHRALKKNDGDRP